MKKGTYKDITGNRYGRLVVTSYVETVNRQTMWECLCDCGEKTTVRRSNLQSGTTKSCGCLLKENGGYEAFGLSQLPEYKSWKNMIDRCYNPEHRSYVDYGQRGIGVCGRWMESDNVGYINFLEDMGPSNGLTLERIEVNGDCCPENCKWDTKSNQGYNQRIRATNKSGRTGVRWYTKGDKWVAYITHNNKSIALGYFNSFEDAVKARETAELKYFGFIKE